MCYGESCARVAPNLAAWRWFRRFCAANFRSLCEDLSHTHALECPAQGKAERTLRLEIVDAPGVEEQLLQGRLPVIEGVRQMRGPVPQLRPGGARRQAIIQPVANQSGPEETVRSNNPRMQWMHVVGVINPEGRLNNRQLHHKFNACRSAQPEIRSGANRKLLRKIGGASKTSSPTLWLLQILKACRIETQSALAKDAVGAAIKKQHGLKGVA